MPPRRGFASSSRTDWLPARRRPPLRDVPARRELARQPARLTMRALGGLASSAGDLAFTWGELHWTRADQPRWGHYARIWQKRTEGWGLVADMLIAAPVPPPPAH